jgi:alkylhydroperoxidase/carboxymuconolactone decarboxylase family protein YurZ
MTDPKPLWEDELGLDPAFSEAVARLSAVPMGSGALEPKVKELILLAVDVSTTHLFKPGVRIHMRRALEAGASRDEILEVLQLVSVLGLHSVTVGVPLLVRALDELDHDEALKERTLTPAQEELRARFERERGYWSSFWEDLLVLDSGYFEAYLQLSTHPWRNGVLPPKVKELVYIAVDGSATHLFVPGLKLHLRQALEHGATREEILEVLQLTSLVGVHASVVGMPLLREALDEVAAKAG